MSVMVLKLPYVRRLHRTRARPALQSVQHCGLTDSLHGSCTTSSTRNEVRIYCHGLLSLRQDELCSAANVC